MYHLSQQSLSLIDTSLIDIFPEDMYLIAQNISQEIAHIIYE